MLLYLKNGEILIINCVNTFSIPLKKYYYKIRLNYQH